MTTASSTAAFGGASTSATAARSTMGYLLIHGGAGILGFLTYFAFSRTVAPAAYADYALVIATAGAVNAFLYSWIGVSLNRYFQDPRVDQGIYLSSIVALFGTISLVVVLVQVAILALWPRPVPFAILLACPIISVLTAWFGVSIQLSAARLQVVNYGIKIALRSSLLLVLGTALALAGLDGMGLLIGCGIGLLAAGVITLRSDLRGVALRLANIGPLRELFGYGWPLALCLGLSWVVGTSDRYLIYWLISEEAAGKYALAYGFAQQPIWLALLASSRATLPLAARAYENGGDAAARQVLSQSLGMLLVICLPVVALEIFGAPQLTGLFLGQAYASAGAAIMPIIALAILLQGLRAFYFDISVHLAKRTRVLIGLWALAAGANVVLNLILIPRLGMIGAAWSTLIAHVLAVAYFLTRVPRPDVLGLGRTDAAKIGAGVLVFAALLILAARFEGAWFLVWACAAGLLYCAVGWMLNPSNLRASLSLRKTAIQASSDCK